VFDSCSAWAAGATGRRVNCNPERPQRDSLQGSTSRPVHTSYRSLLSPNESCCLLTSQRTRAHPLGSRDRIAIVSEPHCSRCSDFATVAPPSPLSSECDGLRTRPREGRRPGSTPGEDIRQELICRLGFPAFKVL
jgi:hypothetical protein